MSSDGENEQEEFLPDNIIGIGEAGKKTVKHYLSQDWILKKAVEARDEKSREEFNAFIIDTATKEQHKDETQVKKINDRIKGIAKRAGRPEDTVSTELEYINPLDDAPDDLIDRAGLTSETTVRKIARSERIKAWWLEDEDEMLTDGYGQGVLRRRGLSKALFHASRTGQGPMESIDREVDGETATIVVGLGGGTGSGMYLDLAKLLTKELDEVHLVATIPGLQENDRRTANAFAALSELEYLALQEEEQNPFTNIILVPFGPARDLQNRETLLDGLVQTIIARESTTNNFSDFLDESGANRIPQAYAPFTIAVPQILRYDVGDVRRIESNIETYREEKRSVLDAELSLYESLHDFFIEEWGGDIGEALEKAKEPGVKVNDDKFTLSGEEASKLRNRLDELQSWIEDEQTFGHVKNAALEDWRNQLSSWITTYREQVSDLSDEEFKKHLITSLPDRVETLKPVDDKYPAEPKERKLAAMFRDELRAIKLRANLLRVVKLLEEDEVREALNTAIHTDRDGWAGVMNIADRVNKLDEETERHKSNLELLDELQSELEDARDHRAKSWRNAVEDDMELFVELQNHADEIESQLSELQEELRKAFEEISNANDPSEVPTNVFSFDFKLLNDRLRKVGLDPVDKNAIESTVTHTKVAYETWHELANLSFLNNIMGKKEDLQEKYVDELGAVDMSLVDIEPTGERGNFDDDFDCELAADDLFDDIIEDLAEMRTNHLNAIVAEFETSVGDIDVSESIEEYRAQWSGDGFDLTWPGDVDDGPEAFRERLSTLDADAADEVFDTLLADGSGFEDQGLVYGALDDAHLGPLESKREELEAQIEESNRRAETYQTLREIVMEHDDSFSGTGPSRPEAGDSTSFVSASESPYVKKTKSEDQTGLLQYEDIGASLIWDDNDSVEMRKIRSHFQQFAENVIDNNETLGLERRTIRKKSGEGDADYSDVNRTVYDGHYIGNVYMSRTFKTDHSNPSHPVFKKVRDQFDGSKNFYFESGDNGYSHESIRFGAPWDLSMVTFVGGVFLDNIRAIQKPSNGYKHSYESHRDELREAVRIRHTHGVDGNDPSLGDEGEGGYVYRDSLLDLEDPEDIYTLLNSTEEDMVQILLDQYVGTTTFPSSIDLSSEE